MSAKRALTAIGLVVALSASACSALPFVADTYRVDIIFPRATALFPDARVKVMGADVGTVRTIEIEGTRLRAILDIESHVPVPADARAAIVPFTLVGGRNVVLTPPWQQGMERLGDGDVIPAERTDLPFEPDEALEAFRDIAEALNPEQLSRFVSEAASSLDERGRDFNLFLEHGGGLLAMLGSQDEVLEEAARNIQSLAAGLNAREEQLGRAISSFSRVTGTLAEERDSIADFLGALARLTQEGRLLLDDFRHQLPADLAVLARVVMLSEAHVDEVAQLVAAFPVITANLIDAYNPNFRALALRITGGASTIQVLRDLLNPLGFTDDQIPCVPLPGMACP